MENQTMSSAKKNQDVETNKGLIRDVADRDGKLVSPIDLSLEMAKQVHLDNLRWVNVDDAPMRMKLTNTGETVIISAKWLEQRPYISGGPLDGNYVFSQIHFHWGSSEHEGSEHTVKGISYPLEMHVVFYKTRYLTQEAALNYEDGVIIVVYLFKIQKESTAGLQWLASYLGKIIEPRSSTLLPPSPISALLIPFTKDYILYWGSLVTNKCSHTMLWFVSRAALGVSLEELNTFRSLLNSRKESMNKNFRETNSYKGRTIFHVNPSTENKHLLLPGSIEPPGKMLLVNFSQMPHLTKEQANKIFKTSQGDCHTDDEYNKMNTDSGSCGSNKKMSSTIPVYGGSDRDNSTGTKIFNENSKNRSSSNESCSYKSSTSGRARRGSWKKGESLNRSISQKRKYVESRKILEKERREEIERRKLIKKDQLLAEQTSKNVNDLGCSRNTFTKQEIKDNTNSPGICIHSNLSLSPTMLPNKQSVSEKTNCFQSPAGNNQQEGDKITTDNKNKKDKEKSAIKSRLPVRTNYNRPGLQSSLAQYFTRPTSAPLKPDNTNNVATPTSSKPNQEHGGKFSSRTSTTSKPLTFSGKCNPNLETKNRKPIVRRPGSHPTKAI